MNRFEKAKHDFLVQVEERGFKIVSEYIDTRTNVKMLCPEGHSNSISPTNFKRGYGCPVCAGVNVKVIQDRINQAKKVHGDKYDYSKWKEGDTAFTKVPVHCKACDKEWITTIDNHVRGRSCPNCRKRISVINKDHGQAIIFNNKVNDSINYINMAQKLHDNKYDYSLIDIPFLVKSKQKIICKEHGEFEQVFYNHAVKGHQCPHCSSPILSETVKMEMKEKYQFGFDKWKSILSEKHPELRFIKHKDGSNTAKDRIIAVCKKHGRWTTKVDSLNSGSGCPACSGQEQKVFYINSVEGTDIIKFGIAIDHEKRLNHQNKRNILQMIPLKKFTFADYDSCRKCESYIKKKYKGVASKHDLKDGWTETAKIKDMIDIMKMVKDKGGIEE